MIKQLVSNERLEPKLSATFKIIDGPAFVRAKMEAAGSGITESRLVAIKDERIEELEEQNADLASQLVAAHEVIYRGDDEAETLRTKVSRMENESLECEASCLAGFCPKCGTAVPENAPEFGAPNVIL